MRWLAGGLIAASLVSIAVFPAQASSLLCGPGTSNSVGVEVSVTGSAPTSCGFGTGIQLATGSDPLSPPLSIIDTAHGGPVTLNVSFSNAGHTDGSFSFDPTGYDNIHIGFQLFNGFHSDRITIPDLANPDWFTMALGSNAAGDFDSDFFGFAFGHSFETISDPILYLVLYGTPAEVRLATPLPAALPLFAGAAGFLGLLLRRRTRRVA
jgi:hypothetical protein